MDILCMKEEAIEKLKSNMKSAYQYYYKENSNEWLWDICEGDPFFKIKEISDFKLADTNENSKAEIEFKNCKILYENLKFINESQASEERLWAGLCHSVFYNYIRQRWGYDKTLPKNEKDAVSGIISRFFFSGGVRSGLYRNTLSKCWWVGKNTYSEAKSNHFEKLDMIGKHDISTKINDIFYSNNFSANPIILDGIVQAISSFEEKGKKINTRVHLRPALQELNSIGGNILLDSLNSDEIEEILLNKIYELDALYTKTELNKKQANVELNIEEDQEDNKTNKTVGIGDYVRIKRSGEEEIKTIVVDYHNRTEKIPKFAKLLIGKSVDEVVEIRGKKYLIESIN